MAPVLRIGVLALQGDFQEHIAALQRLNADTREVRSVQDLEEVEALIVPGGESTTIIRLLRLFGLESSLVARARSGMPVWGSCAGLIVSAREATDLPDGTLKLIDIAVDRNAYGRQVDSFETDLKVPALGDAPFHAIFIRAPRIREMGAQVETLAQLEDGTPVAARQGNVLVTAFHPELTPDARFHGFFLDMVRRNAPPARQTSQGEV